MMPNKKKTRSLEWPKIELVENEKSDLLSKICTDIGQNDIDTILKRIVREMEFLIYSEKIRHSNLRWNDYANSYENLERMSKSLLRELKETHFDIKLGIHMEILGDQNIPDYFNNKGLYVDEDYNFLKLEKELENLYIAVTDLKKGCGNNLNRETRGAAKKEMPKKVIQKLRDIFKSYTIIKDTERKTKGHIEILSEFEEKEVAFICSVMNLASEKGDTGYDEQYWTKQKVRRLFHHNK